MATKKNIQTIILSEHFSVSVSFRASVTNLLNVDLTGVDVLRIDFSDIEYISRSVAHQFLVDEKKLKKEFKLQFELLNRNDLLVQLFDTVKNSRRTNISTDNIKSIEFSSHADLSKFLMAV